MNNTSLSILLTSFFMRRELPSGRPEQLLNAAQRFLKRRQHRLGRLISCQCLHRRQLSKDMRVTTYELCYEQYTLLLKFTYFHPRGHWELQDLKWHSHAAA